MKETRHVQRIIMLKADGNQTLNCVGYCGFIDKIKI